MFIIETAQEALFTRKNIITLATLLLLLLAIPFLVYMAKQRQIIRSRANIATNISFQKVDGSALPVNGSDNVPITDVLTFKMVLNGPDKTQGTYKNGKQPSLASFSLVNQVNAQQATCTCMDNGVLTSSGGYLAGGIQNDDNRYVCPASSYQGDQRSNELCSSWGGGYYCFTFNQCTKWQSSGGGSTGGTPRYGTCSVNGTSGTCDDSASFAFGTVCRNIGQSTCQSPYVCCSYTGGGGGSSGGGANCAPPAGCSPATGSGCAAVNGKCYYGSDTGQQGTYCSNIGQNGCSNGTYCYASNCGGTSTTPKYKCSGGSCSRDDAAGTFTDSNCNNSCSGGGGTTTPKYKCSGTSCIRDDASGSFTASNCNDSCNAGGGGTTCGTQGQACCTTGTICQSGLSCISNTCQQCGAATQACCTTGTACQSGLTCQSSVCNPPPQLKPISFKMAFNSSDSALDNSLIGGDLSNGAGSINITLPTSASRDQATTIYVKFYYPSGTNPVTRQAQIYYRPANFNISVACGPLPGDTKDEGTLITITGQNLGTGLDQQNPPGKIMVGSNTASVVAGQWSDNQIKATLSSANQRPIVDTYVKVIKPDGSEGSSICKFTDTTPVPIVSAADCDIDIDSTTPQTIIKLTGTNFGQNLDAAGYRVTVGDKPTIISSGFWTNTSITATLQEELLTPGTQYNVKLFKNNAQTPYFNGTCKAKDIKTKAAVSKLSCTVDPENPDNVLVKLDGADLGSGFDSRGYKLTFADKPTVAEAGEWTDTSVTAKYAPTGTPPVADKQYYVKLYRPNRTTPYYSDICILKDLTPRAQLAGVTCQIDPENQEGTLITITGSNFGSNLDQKGYKVMIGNSQAVVPPGKWSDKEISAKLSSQPAGVQYVKLIRPGASQTAYTTSQCAINTSVLDFKAALSCRAVEKPLTTASVEIRPVNVVPGGQSSIFKNDKVSFDKEGRAQGITAKLNRGTQYKLIVKAPQSLKRVIPFTAGNQNTTSLPAITLFLGDILPSGGDGVINSLDYTELRREWSVGKDASEKPADFNADGRVNTLDYACLSSNFAKASDTE